MATEHGPDLSQTSADLVRAAQLAFTQSQSIGIVTCAAFADVGTAVACRVLAQHRELY